MLDKILGYAANTFDRNFITKRAIVNHATFFGMMRREEARRWVAMLSYESLRAVNLATSNINEGKGAISLQLALATQKKIARDVGNWDAYSFFDRMMGTNEKSLEAISEPTWIQIEANLRIHDLDSIFEMGA
ncbi:hypothetical protein OAG1_15830 [Agarivorans sp. OAG1]|uniref:hypothetical protein n=1 Tax=Agarivorans sp. OAG1 TaxID=3082387 RepID=UPI002B2E4E0A|nr:hypothetical protein OAG1_15830 [Agarivorans sp. OAG1]